MEFDDLEQEPPVEALAGIQSTRHVHWCKKCNNQFDCFDEDEGCDNDTCEICCEME